MNTQHKLLSAALAVALFSAAPVFAQDAGTDTGTDTETTDTETSSVPKDRLVDRYADAAGSEEAADGLVTSLRDGDDLTVATTTTTTTTNADGTTTTTTATSDVVIENPNGPMGWGEVDKALGIAEKLVEDGKFENLEDALAGSADITNPDGTVIEGSAGILQLRADGMGWGQIAKELGFNLGKLVSAGNKNAKATDAAAANAERASKAKSERAAKPDKADKAERASGKPDRVVKAERPSRPDKIDRPAKPERPAKPDRGGR